MPYISIGYILCVCVRLVCGTLCRRIESRCCHVARQYQCQCSVSFKSFIVARESHNNRHKQKINNHNTNDDDKWLIGHTHYVYGTRCAGEL
jgi:hypothetical protein